MQQNSYLVPQFCQGGSSGILMSDYHVAILIPRISVTAVAQWSQRGGVGLFFQIFVYAFYSITLSFYKEKRSLYEPKNVKFHYFWHSKMPNLAFIKEF